MVWGIHNITIVITWEITKGHYQCLAVYGITRGYISISYQIPWNHHVPMVFPWFNHHFPMLFHCFSDGFPMVSPCSHGECPCQTPVAKSTTPPRTRKSFSSCGSAKRSSARNTRISSRRWGEWLQTPGRWLHSEWMVNRWLVVTGTWLSYFSIYWGCHHPNWLSYFWNGMNPPTS